ncbi:MAG: NUDIX domain-containing protein [Planctomycetota bacterium]
MPLKAKYCSQCGESVAVREIDGKHRDVCPSCDTVFYQNPLPVASSVVLNKDRQVLLVKRRNEPHKGMWCLPIGFAETGETIADAAGRELKEEAGIEARKVRLLDSDSFESEFYGDLLIVSFEMEKVGGEEAPGDDAEEVRYFPLDVLPPLAFSANKRAIDVCVEAHRDEWAIRDSFDGLQSEEDRELLSDALVSLIRDHAEEVTRGWFDEVRSNPTTASYQKVDPNDLFAGVYGTLSRFGGWLKGDEADEEVRSFFRSLGRRRHSQGCAVHEVISSLTLLRKHVWMFARGQGVWERPIDMYRVLELSRRIAHFFDKAMYHMTVGFTAE